MAEARRSGQTQIEFCRQRGLAVSTLQYWMRKLRRRLPPGQPVQIVPVRVVPGAVRELAEVEARVGAVAIRFRAGTAVEYVSALLRALAEPC